MYNIDLSKINSNPYKEKCDKLKRYRKEMADILGIDLQQQECTYKGPCLGTCPKCKEEEIILNKKLLENESILILNKETFFNIKEDIPTTIVLGNLEKEDINRKINEKNIELENKIKYCEYLENINIENERKILKQKEFENGNKTRMHQTTGMLSCFKTK